MGDFKVLEGQDAESLEDPFLEEEGFFFFFFVGVKWGQGCRP